MSEVSLKSRSRRRGIARVPCPRRVPNCPSIQSGADILHQQKHMQRIGGAGLKIKAFVKGFGPLILRMGDKRAHPNQVRCAGGSHEGVLQKRLSQPYALGGLIDGKAGQDHERDGMAGQALTGARCRLRVFDSPSGKGIIARDDAIASRAVQRSQSWAALRLRRVHDTG